MWKQEWIPNIIDYLKLKSGNQNQNEKKNKHVKQKKTSGNENGFQISLTT